MRARPVLRGVLVALLSAALVTGAHPAAATEALQLSVSTQGDDSGTCTQAAPCRTPQRAVDVAGSSPAVITVAAGSYDHGEATIAAGQHISIVGAGTDYISGTTLDTFDTGPVLTNSGWLSVTDVRFWGSARNAITQSAGTLRMTGDLVETMDGVDATGGSVTIANMTFGGDSAPQGTYSLQVAGADVVAANVSLDEPVVVTDGTLHADGIYAYDTPNFLQVSGGAATLSRSYLGFDTWAVDVTGTGALIVVDSTLDDDTAAVSVTSADASAEFIDDTIAADPTKPSLDQTAGALELAGTALVIPVSNHAPLCSGSVVDGGWNLTTDDSCDLTATGSQQGVDNPDLDQLLHPTAFEGGLPDRSPTGTSALVDVIPIGATASFDPTIALCAPGSVDQRGQTRPVHGRCDVGAVELSPTVMSSRLSTKTVVYPQPLTMTATLAQPVGQVAPARLLGTVGFTTWWQSRCLRVRIDSAGNAQCTYHLAPGTYPITATFQPTDAFHANHVERTVVVERALTHLAVTTRPTVPTAGNAFTLRARLLTFLREPIWTKVTVDGKASSQCRRLHLDLSGSCTLSGLTAGTHTVRVVYGGSLDRQPAAALRHIRVAGPSRA